ncbi:MAG: serine hydrolase, partial [Pseudomonadota bacterium]
LGVWSFSAGLEGCEGRVRLIERRGLIGDIKVRNFIAPDLGRSLVAMSEQPAFEFGEVWTASGPSYTMLSKGFCGH